MEQTHQYPIQFPAACAVLAEEEMIYIEGGSYSFNVGNYQVIVNIDPDDVMQFMTNLVVNTIRLFGEAAFSSALNGLQNGKNDGLTIIGTIKHFWNSQNSFGKVSTFVMGGFAGYYLYCQATQLFATGSSLYEDLVTAYEQTMSPQLTPIS